ncbi:MAG TPA: helix-turn-helix domain-containing protein [Gemmataceae bacterium]|jgi:transcriptional regulator with XRE-family HTH domain
MPRKIIADSDSRKRIAALRAKGLTLQEIGNLFGVSRQGVQRVLRADASHRRIRCRVCESEINPAGAMLRDDRQVLCLACLATCADASFGDHLQAFRLAAGLRIVALAKLARVKACQISSYEEGRIESAAWPIQRRLFQALGIELVMRPALSARRPAGVTLLTSVPPKTTRQKTNRSA